MNAPSGRTKRLLLALLVTSSLALALLIAVDWLPHLRGPAPETSEWYWPYLLRPFVRWWPSVTLAAVITALSAWWFSAEKTSRRRDAIGLGGLLVGSFLLQLALIYADRPTVSAELVDRTLSNLASGFFEPAAEIEDITAVLRDYPNQMPAFTSEHARTHPPGLVVGNWLTIQSFAQWPALAEYIARFIRPLRCTDLWLLDRPAQVAAALAVSSVLPLLAAAAAVLPAYGLGRLILSGRARRVAAALAATIPALLLFSPKSVQLYALLVLTLFWVFQSAVTNRSLLRYYLAGLILSVMTYLSLGNAALYLLLLLFAILQWRCPGRREDRARQYQDGWQALVKQLAIFSLGAASLWVLTLFIWHVPPWEIARAGLQQHYLLATSQRRYDWWVLWNLLDLLLFSGWAMMLGFGGSIVLAINFWREERRQPAALLSLCLLVLIFLLDLSGTARGEVGRLWLFFIPLIAFPAARFWSVSLPSHKQLWLVIALQLLMVVAIGLAWRPVRPVIVVAQEPDMPTVSPGVTLQTHFIGQPFALAGFSLEVDQAFPGGQINLTLFWEAQNPTQRPYTVFNHLVDSKQQVVAQQDGWPVGGTWPSTCWRRGDVIVDTHQITLPENLPAGDYRLLTGMYDTQSGQRVRLQNGQDAVDLGPVSVRRPADTP